MLGDDGYEGGLLAEMTEITDFLGELIENALEMLQNGDEDAIADLVTRSAVDIYDYKCGKPLRCRSETHPTTKKSGWTVY